MPAHFYNMYLIKIQLLLILWAIKMPPVKSVPQLFIRNAIGAFLAGLSLGCIHTKSRLAMPITFLGC